MVKIDECQIEDKIADDIIYDIRGMLRSFKIKVYDEDSGYGLLRHVLVRRGFRTGEVMVVLVLASPILPSKNNFVKALREKHPEVTTVVVNVNDGAPSVVLGERNITIYGKGFIEDEAVRTSFPHFSIFILSGESGTDRNPLWQSYRVCRIDRKRKGN